MKKRLIMTMAMALMMAVTPMTAFAGEKAEDAETAAAINEALAAAGDLGGTVAMYSLPNGIAYGQEVYDLGDGKTLVMEFEEGEDGLKNFIKDNTEPVIQPLATNGEILWKDYGSRYFTAKSTVSVGLTSGSLILENHYTLSSQGIDERYGVTDGSPKSGNSYVTPGSALVSNQTARLKGSSEVRMYADYTVTSKTGTAVIKENVYRLTTSVGYMDQNTAASQVKVKHSWTLSAIK